MTNKIFKYDDGPMPCGTVVKWSEKWSRPDEHGERFVIVESYDRGALIVSLTSRNVFGYKRRVDWEMINEA